MSRRAVGFLTAAVASVALPSMVYTAVPPAAAVAPVAVTAPVPRVAPVQDPADPVGGLPVPEATVPVDPPVDPAVEFPVDPPVEPPVDPPVEPLVEAPVEPPVDRPVSSVPRPLITSLSPAVGPLSGVTLVTISGTDLDGATGVRFGGEPAQVLTVSAEHITALALPAGSTGNADVSVMTQGGTSLPTALSAFTYVNGPLLLGVSPDDGPADGGTVVTVRGQYLEGVTSVLFGSKPGTNLVRVSAAELRITAPPSGAVRSVDVLLVSDAGTSAPVEANTFAYRAAATAALVAVDRSWWPLGLIGVLSWSVWFFRRFLSRHRYAPVLTDHTATTSIVVPVYREDADVLERCLRTWVRESPSEIVLVVDDRDEVLLRRLAELPRPGVRVLQWRHTGKRGALAAGVREATGEIVVFADSDTEWRPGLLREILKPFADPMVGGVGSRQHVYLPASNLWRRVAYWLLNTRYLDYVPAMSRRGGVACLSGRTAAYRRSVIRPLLPSLEHEVFLGRECIAGDDGRLTWLVLAAGYRTVHQDTAQADSMFPDELRAFVLQRIRWSRNSYRCYLTAVSHGWLWRQPFITQVTVLQVLLTPVSMGATVWYGTRFVGRGGLVALAVVLVWAVLGRALRATSHLTENPREIVLAPLLALVVAGIALPVKFWAMLTMNRQGWLTRGEGVRVQGQGEIEVSVGAGVS